MCIEELKLLQAQNEELKKQNTNLQQEVKQWKYEYEMLDTCLELEQGKISELKKEISTLQGSIDAYQMSENEANEIIAELKAENDRLKEENFNFEEIIKLCRCKQYQQTLQKIKKHIAKICKEECGYVQKKRCPDCDCRYGAILDLITKAEEE